MSNFLLDTINTTLTPVTKKLIEEHVQNITKKKIFIPEMENTATQQELSTPVYTDLISSGVSLPSGYTGMNGNMQTPDFNELDNHQLYAGQKRPSVKSLNFTTNTDSTEINKNNEQVSKTFNFLDKIEKAVSQQILKKQFCLFLSI